MDGEAGWWTTSGNIGLPPLARAMGVGRQQQHGILLHKLRSLGISGNIGIWLYHFLTNRSHFVRLPGGISKDHPVISGVPQGTVLGPLLFLIMIADIDKGVSDSNLISFVDDTRLYSGVGDVTDCDNLQFDLDTV